ncbi:cytochrome P450 [Streptomyces sp. CB02400]|uniref:cytochrome P450 n=1 Tax=Streptomyces sp. CB02400 TaxID=1703944 RepID=UPI000939282D|nr:cytochrome P450 [Streptomyces sp. CB02400]OKK00012.1 cytochrome [Streptomyces sp. CB02400]
MDVLSRPLLDRTLPLLAEGYAWLPNRMRDTPGPVVRTRILGRPALALRGPEAVRFFYDEQNVHRHRAIPEPVLATLFGHEAVHTLDGVAHRTRKSLFLPLLAPGRIAGLVDHVTEAWDEAVPAWGRRGSVVLFDEAGTVLTTGVHRWAGIPLDDAGAEATARDMIAMVDGFATAGPRHLRARRARARQEDRLGRLVRDVRSGAVTAPEDSVLDLVCRHRDADGGGLDEKTAAVELLNVVRPTAAVAWFVAFTAHALHKWPEHRAPLAGGDVPFTAAFAHEVRRFYPFVPFLGGLAARDLYWRGEWVPAGGLVVLDVYGQNHDESLWGDPYAFRPRRFLERPVERDELIPQGGGDPATGHRCPGEGITVGVLEALAVRLARMEYTVPEQNLTIPLHRVPTRPHSGVLLSGVRPPAVSS